MDAEAADGRRVSTAASPSWQAGRAEDDAFNDTDWSWLSLDGAMIRAPSAGKTRPNPTDRAKSGTKCPLLVEGSGVPVGLAMAGANINDFKMFAERILEHPGQAAHADHCPAAASLPGQGR